jgi:hypothetical protein
MVSKPPAKDQETPAAPSAEVAVLDGAVALEYAKSFNNIADVQQYFASLGVELTAGEDELGDGYERTDNKDRFCDTPLVLVDWTVFMSSEFNQPASSIRIMTFAGEKFRISDGSTGIHKQLEELTAVRVRQGRPTPRQGLILKGGLRKSEYWISVVDGLPLNAQEAEETPLELRRKAKTYYLNV